MKKVKIVMIVFVIVLSLNLTISFARYKEVIYGNASANLKNPIFIVEKSQKVEGKMSSLNNNYCETTFNVLNYIQDNQIENVSEIDFFYTIKIVPSTLSFPVKYKLINLQTNEEVELNSNLETGIINLGTNKENHNYKLIVEWDLENTNQELDEFLNIEILINGVQKNN